MMIGWADDMVCYFKKLIIEVVVNEHPATCGGVCLFLPLPHWTVLSTLPQTAVPSLPAGRHTGQQCCFISWREAE